MRFQVQSRSVLRAGAVAALLVTAAWLTGCSSGPQLRVTSVRNLNSPTRDKGHRLGYRIIQFKEAPTLAGTQFPAVWKQEKSALPGVVGEPIEGSFDPDTTVAIRIKKAPGAKAYAILGNFYKPQGECWYLVQEFGKKSSAVVTAGASCFTPGTAK